MSPLWASAFPSVKWDNEARSIATWLLGLLVSSLPYEADTPYVLRQGPHLPRFTDEEIEAQIRFSLPPRSRRPPLPKVPPLHP